MRIRVKAFVKELSSPLTRTDDIVNRKKRLTPFGIIGTLSKTLFGTLNTEGAENFNTQIDKLYQDQKNIICLVKDQAHLVKFKYDALQ
ncbi:hypothetical protein DD595_25015, partial [Enterobacter cloacae complex sp. 4DZ3-17B2]|uniref:hypothetical protein n=1 Tax=Enterobacter cloacae complex sp. 4DZ3-17B2 TaxID=2511990 RepID=UPI001025E8EB